jgi:hypothetical protein
MADGEDGYGDSGAVHKTFETLLLQGLRESTLKIKS